MSQVGRTPRFFRMVATALAICMLFAFVPATAGAAGSTVSGTVTLDGVPVADAWVDIYDYVTDEWIADAVTDASGAFSIPALAPGQYYIDSWDELYEVQYGTSDPFTLDGVNPHVVDIDSVSPPTGDATVTGTVKVNGIAIANAWVYLVDESVDEVIDAAQTDATGKYTLASVAEGNYHLEVWNSSETAKLGLSGSFACDGLATYTKDMAFTIVDKPVIKVAGLNRFNGSVVMAENAFDPFGDASWPGVTDVVLACGDDRAAADPLAASGLTWYYSAPLLLTSSGSTDLAVKEAIKQIAKANGEVTIHIVGGTVSVPEARINEIVAHVGSAGVVKKDRVLPNGGRFELSAAIADRVAAGWAGNAPDVVLVANGADPAKFFDALALSPIAASQGYPILLVDSDDTIPAETWNKIKQFKAAGGATKVVVGGGEKTVTPKVASSLGAERWAGSTRYSTALVVADEAESYGYLTLNTLGIAAKLPDALTGGSTVGYQYMGALILTDGLSLTPETAAWLKANKTSIDEVQCFGGDKSLTPTVRAQIKAAIM